MVKHKQPTIAIFGGSFDPPHVGHQRIVREALKYLDIDKLLIVPAYLNPFKKSSLASAPQRLKWCRTIFKKTQNVIVDDYEIRQKKPTTTIKSVKYLERTYHVKYLIIGSDNLSTLTQWHRFKWLNENIIWVIITREKHPLKTKNLRAWRILKLSEKISSTDIRIDKKLTYVDKKIEKSVQNILKG